MRGWMNGWKEGWMNEWMNGWNEERMKGWLNEWLTDWLTTCCEIWTKSIPLIILSISRTDPMLGGWIWIGGSPVLLLPWSKFKLFTTILQGSSRNFTLQWVPKSNFVFKTSRAQGGMFCRQICWGNPCCKIFYFRAVLRC